MKRLSKRIISSVLTGTMLLSLLGGSALAVEPEGARKRSKIWAAGHERRGEHPGLHRGDRDRK